MPRFLLRFVVLGILALVLEAAAWHQAGFTDALLRGLAQSAALVTRSAGAEAGVEANRIYNSVGVTVHVTSACSALDVVLIVWASILAFPATGRERLMALGASLLLLQTMNVFRLAVLVWASQRQPDWFPWLHQQAGGVALTLCGIGFFLLWAARVTAPLAPQREGSVVAAG